jgi:release factor glutamine methyltransferase
MVPLPTDPTGDALLVHAAAGDPDRLARLRERVRAGEPAAYAAGCLVFRGRRFAIDPRAYITDPELTHLVDVVNVRGRELARSLARPLRAVEFGVGAGSLALSIALENPDWMVTGLDVDPPALALARDNAVAHAAKLELLESDFFSAWPDGRAGPDLIFGDPPWGGAEDLYADERDAEYYRRMPARSAFPPGPNRCALHDELIQRVCERGWTSLLLLNYGVLPRDVIARSAAALGWSEFISPAPHLTIVAGRLR